MMESELFEPVKRWLESTGATVHAEVPWPVGGGGPIDVVGVVDAHGVIDAHVRIVELKRCFSWKVLKQAALAQSITWDVWAAAAANPGKRAREIATREGFGLLSIRAGAVQEIIAPRQSVYDMHFTLAKRLLAALPGEPNKEIIGGVPCQRGIGPAQDAQKRVAAYRAAHPNASWRTIWKCVPNHYVNAASMCAALRNIGIRAEQKAKEPDHADKAPRLVAAASSSRR